VTVLEVIQRSTEFLARKGLDSPRLQVELLLAHILEVPRLKLYLDFERPLTDAELDAMRQLIKRRASHEPLQHLVGSTSFCGLEIMVNGHVLIPRPETEVLAEHAWQFLQARCRAGAASVSALDFGTGSGCLAVAIAHHALAAQVDALDLSAAALEVARQNASRHQLSNRIRFYEGDGFRALPPDSRYDLIAANPPYIPSREIEELAPEVRDHDPRVALDGGPDGLDLVRRLAVEGAEFLKPAGQLLCEFGDGQAEAVSRIYEERHWRVEAIAPDLSGRARILVARPAES
jgi:release factor glutamine methyltransferase